jgi:diguanylate cyclase (GGDEF)-like protein/PAS domain S-box-containing protein
MSEMAAPSVEKVTSVAGQNYRGILRQALRRRDAIMRVVSFAAEQLLSSTSASQLQLVLNRLGIAAGVDRMYLFENGAGERSEIVSDRLVEWDREGVTSQIDNRRMQHIQLHEEPYVGWSQQLGRGAAVMAHVRELPEAVQAIMAPQQVRSFLIVPIFVAQNWWGFLWFDACHEERIWPEPEIEAFRAVASLFGAAFTRSRTEQALRNSEQRYRELYAVARRRTRDLALLDQVRIALEQPMSQAELFRTVVERIADTFGYTFVSLFTRTGDMLHLQHQVGYTAPIGPVHVSEGVTGRVVRTGTSAFVTEPRLDPDFIFAMPDIESLICVPLFDQGSVIGTLNVESAAGIKLTSDEHRLLLTLGQSVSMALERTRLYAEARADEARYRQIFDVLTEGIVVVNANRQAMAWNRSALDILQITEQNLNLLLQGSLPFVTIREDGQSFTDEDGPLSSTLRDGIPQRNVVMGLQRANQSITWVLINTRPLFIEDEPRPYAVVISFADISERKKLEETLRQQALHDPLTGLYNRRYLEETLDREMRRARRTDEPLGVMMIDIDHFKQYNDRYGHAGGDVLLDAFGKFLRQQVRSEDTVCRYGGEEFTLLLPGATLEETIQRAEMIRAAVKHVQVVFDQQLLEPMTISIGVAAYPTSAADSSTLLRIADIGLYTAKDSGRDRVVVGPDARAEESGASSS